MRRLPAILAAGACLSALLSGLPGLSRSAAAFTASTTVSANAFGVDHLGNYFSVVPGADGVAAGDVDTLSVTLGLVASARTFTDVLTVTNVSGTPQTASLALAGVPQVAAASFGASGTATVTLAPGASTSVTITTSATTAGRGAGTLELRLGGSRWLYRTYSLSLDQAPAAPASLTAIARAAGRVALAWGASATTNLTGYDVYRAAGAGALTKLATVAGLGYDDTATVDGTAYRYAVRAVSSGVPSFESLATPEAAATADATAPAQPTVTAPAYANVANAAAFQVTVTLPGGSLSTDTLEVRFFNGASSVTTTAAATQGAGTAIVSVDTSSVLDGPATVRVTSTDAAGNVSGAANRDVTKDTVAPAAPTRTYSDVWTADQITGTAEAGATIRATQTAPRASGPYTATASGTGAYTVTVAVAKGVTVGYTLTATDAAGNVGPAATLSFATNR
jgi:hypothetical protein